MKTIVCALCLGLSLTGPARADFRTYAGASGGSVYQKSDGTFDRSDFANFWVEGATSSAAGGSDMSSSGWASVSLGSNPGLHLYSSAASGGSISSSEAIVGAGWEDVIRVTGTAPATLRIVLQVEGRFDLREAGMGLSSGEARVGVALLPDYASPINGTAIAQVAGYGNAFPVSEVYAAEQSEPYPDFFLTGDNTNAPTYEVFNLRRDLATGAVTWDVYFNLNYDAALGGYGMNLYASAYTLGYLGGSGTADFGSTIRLTAVTQADGSAIPGGVTFDSGFTLADSVNPAPAPGGLLLMASGGVILLVRGRRRWMGATTAA